jgi:hypothetical protein
MQHQDTSLVSWQQQRSSDNKIGNSKRLGMTEFFVSIKATHKELAAAPSESDGGRIYPNVKLGVQAPYIVDK